MSRLIVITTPELAPGYQLAGVATVPVGSSEEAASRLRELIEVQRERGVIALHEPYHRELDRDLRREMDELQGRSSCRYLPARGARTSPSGANGCCGCCGRPWATK